VAKWLVWDERRTDPVTWKAATDLEAVFNAAHGTFNTMEWEGPRQFFVRQDAEGSETHQFVVTPEVTPVQMHVTSGVLFRPSKPTNLT
jgi:hypothetical protein